MNAAESRPSPFASSARRKFSHARLPRQFSTVMKTAASVTTAATPTRMRRVMRQPAGVEGPGKEAEFGGVFILKAVEQEITERTEAQISSQRGFSVLAIACVGREPIYTQHAAGCATPSGRGRLLL